MDSADSDWSFIVKTKRAWPHGWHDIKTGKAGAEGAYNYDFRPSSHLGVSTQATINKFQLDSGEKMAGSLLSTPYPTASEWKRLVEEFSPEAIAHKLLLAHVPYVFRDEPLKYALFRKTIADAFNIEPSSVFIAGSAMAGRSLKGADIDKTYSSSSDFDTLIISEHLFTDYVMKSLAWVKEITCPDYTGKRPKSPEINSDNSKFVGWLATHACKGIWRPDSLPVDAMARIQFFETFADVSLKTLGLQLSDDTVAKVNGRIARSFDDAVKDLSASIYRLRKEFRGEKVESNSESEAPSLTPEPQA